MKTILVTFIFLVELIFSFSSFAIDPGSATGSLKVGRDVVTLTHAYAHFHDNDEGWLDNKKEMRILVSDREVDQDAISGLNPFFTLSALVKQGLVRGVLIRFPALALALLGGIYGDRFWGRLLGFIGRWGW